MDVKSRVPGKMVEVKEGLTEGEGDYLEPHAYSIMQQIEDPEIRGLHVMEG